MNRIITLALLAVAILAPGCSKKSSDDGVLVDTNVYYVRQGNIAQAWMSAGAWAGGQFIDSGTTFATPMASKAVAGTTVTHAYGIRFIVYIKANRLWAHDVASGSVLPIGNDTTVNAILAVVDTDPVGTSAAATYVLYTTLPAAGLFDLRAAQVVGPGGAAPAVLEAGIPSSTTFTIRQPRDAFAAHKVFYRASDASGVLKRCDLTGFPTANVATLSGADDVQEFIVRDSTRVVYRRASGELMKADSTSLPALVLYTPAATESVQLKGKIELGADSEVFFTSHVDTNADMVPDQVSLRRVIYSTGTPTTFDGPYAYAALTLNRVFFTGTRVVWQVIYDATSVMQSYDRTAPPGAVNLLTGGRALDPVANAYAIYDAAGWRVLYAETSGPVTFRVAKTDAGVLVNEFAFAGTPGTTDAINHLGTSYYDASLDLAAPTSAARFVFVDGTSLKSRTALLPAASELTLGTLPADIVSFSLATTWRSPTCVAGVTTPPPQNDIFFYRGDGGGTLQRQTTSTDGETPLGAQ